MPKVIFQSSAGDRRTIEIPDGQSVMLGAVQEGVDGIDADCGGACACATCHVYVAEEWLGRLEAPSDMERSMLDFAENVRPTSRLSCQIKVSQVLCGLEVETPESQH